MRNGLRKVYLLWLKIECFLSKIYIHPLALTLDWRHKWRHYTRAISSMLVVEK